MCVCLRKSLFNIRRYISAPVRINSGNVYQPRCFSENIASRNFHEEFKETDASSKPKVPGAVASRYQVFKDKDSPIIFDVEEERQRIGIDTQTLQDEANEEFFGINLERGVNGVFEIEDLVTLLQRDKAMSIFVAAVPSDIKYVDYMCITTGRNQRHMLALAQFVRKAYKMKRAKGDLLPKIEGAGSKDWIALDLGNIALHIFSSDARELYDLDTLWAVGPKYDPESNKPEDPITAMLERHTIYLHDLQPKE